ncbi:MAG: hypothetical protein JOZ81_30915 [Chloroflexi bacterium]|nr:hypothetical protein [Chloroflexota bacterium]
MTQMFAILFPWSLDYRLLMLAAIAQALLAGAGGVVLVRGVDAWLQKRHGWPARAVRLGRAGVRLIAVTWVILVTWAMTVFMTYPADAVNGFSADDAAAMAWLRANAAPGSLVANDTYADAGIWIPFKAGLPIVLPRILLTNDGMQRTVMLQNITRLNEVPEARAEACALDVVYVYRGAKNSSWQERVFPLLEDLRASPDLQEVFSSGEAVVFRTRLKCVN